MNLKQYCRYQIDFMSKWVAACPIMMGLAFFINLLYYFAITTMRDVFVVELIAAMLLGIILTAGYVICITCLRLNAPGLYAIMGAVQCLMLLILGCMTGNGFRIFVSILWYVFAALVLLATTGGYLPGRLLAALMFFIPVGFRFFFYDLGRLSLFGWIKEVPVLLILAGLGALAMGLKPVNKTR